MDSSTHIKAKKRVLIIGGGLAGLSLASELVGKHFDVTVLERDSHLGGRASSTIDPKMHDPVPIGPHVFVSSYKYFPRFLKRIGAVGAISWQRKIFLEIVYKKRHHQLKLYSLLGPFYMVPWLFQYPFMGWKDKVHLIRFSLKIAFSTSKDLEKLDNQNAYEFLVGCGVSKRAIDSLWRLFVLSLLNVPLTLCSAAELALLMKHWSEWKTHKFGFAKVGLGDVYTKDANVYITKRGGTVMRNATVRRIVCNENGVGHVEIFHEGKVTKVFADLYVSTLNPIDLRTILPPEILSSEFFCHLNCFEPVPYISVNLWLDRKITRKKFWALLHDSDSSPYLNTDFYDQSNIYQTRKDKSLITSNIIYSKPYEHLSDAEIVQRTMVEIKEAFPHSNAVVEHAHVHRIPYVIYASLPGMRQHKLPNKTPFRNLYLAGDWTVKELTQCMESAVMSGYQCAETIVKDLETQFYYSHELENR